MVTEKEQHLRARMQYEDLIACCHKRDDMVWLSDIRGGEGEKLDLPDDLVISIGDSSLVEGEFYSFQWKIKTGDPLAIEIIGELHPVNKKDFLNRLYKIEAQKKGGALMQSVNYQKMVFSEVTGADYTFIYELLQNANDYPFGDEAVNVKFILTPHYMFFFHSGSEFNLLNVVGICSVNQGEKKNKTKTIGYKGIGFKTVFVNNNYVYLESGDWKFRFDELTACDHTHMAGECAWSLMPFPTDRNELEPEAYDIISQFGSNYRVRFAMRHRFGNAFANLEQFDKVFKDAQILLFIPHVMDVEVLIGGNRACHVSKDSDKWIVAKMPYDVPPLLREWIEDDINKGGKTPVKFKDIETVNISFAVQKEGNRLIPVEDARIYNYLPTEIRMGIPFLINADFIPDSSRSGLHEVKWNWLILEQCGRYFVEWWATFTKKEGQYDLSSVFDILPDVQSKDNYTRNFNNGYESHILEVEAFPTIKDKKYSVQKFSEIIYDTVGLTNTDSPIFSDEEFYKFCGINGFLPHPSIRNHRNLITLFENYPGDYLKYTGTDLVNLCFNNEFKQWLLEKKNNIRFLTFVINQGWISNLSNYQIFLNSNGILSKASDLYNSEIEKYMEDLDFLSDQLPRLDADVYKALTSHCPTWEGFVKNNFIHFSDYRFTKNIFDNFAKFSNRFETLENNVHFIHFLAITDFPLQMPEGFRFFSRDGQMVSNDRSLYLWTKAGDDFITHTWVDARWITFLHEQYVLKDRTIVETYLSNVLQINELSETRCYEDFIGNADYIDQIANNIKEIGKSRDFYLYLSSINLKVRFTPQMRETYTLKVTDTHKESWVSVGKTIFYQSDEWRAIAQEAWMPEGICLGLCNDYFWGLAEKEEEQLNSFLKSCQFVQAYRVLGLKAVLLSTSVLSQIFTKIETTESSISFMNFLFENRKDLFGNEHPISELQKIPVKTRLHGMTSSAKFSPIYIPNEDLDSLYYQSWFSSKRPTIVIIDTQYINLFSGIERTTFFQTLGFKPFLLKDYILQRLFPTLDIIANSLKNRNTNFEFHRYFCSIHNKFTDDEIKPLLKMPIFISAPNIAEGLCVDKSEGHYMPSDILTDIIQRDLVPISIMDSVHPDYITKDADITYYRDKLQNVDIDLEKFADYISEKEIVVEYLHDKDRNIRFWQWVVSSGLDAGHRSILAKLPLLCKSENEDAVFSIGHELYISDEYSGVPGNELFISKYIKDAKFVSPEYQNGVNQQADWKALFASLKVSTNNKDIVFKKIIPSLHSFQDMSIVPVLAQYYLDIKLRLEKEEVFEQLSKLRLKCIDGVFRNIDSLVITGRYYDIECNPLPEVVVPVFVSEEYLKMASGNDSLRRNIQNFIVLLADTYKVGIETATKLRETKIKKFCTHQESYSSEDIHYSIIGYLADEYNRDSVGIDELLQEIGGSIKLYSTRGVMCSASSLHFSSIYSPECDFMGNGVNTLIYVSEKYGDYSRHMKNFLMRCLKVCGYFKTEDVQYLSKERFAVYFWNFYAPKHQERLESILSEGRLSHIRCLPTMEGMKAPLETYDYRDSVLKAMVKQLPEDVAHAHMPTIELPKWMEGISIGMKRKLTVCDCLKYLSKEIIPHRRDAIGWLIEAGEDEIHACQKEISSFRETAKWINGEKGWSPIKELVALEWGNETLKNYFGSNSSVCSTSFMPENKEDYNKLCHILAINIISNNNFEKQKIGWTRDESAIKEMKKRLLYLSYKTNSFDWKGKYEDYCRILDSSDISRCGDIGYRYNDEIKTNLVDFIDESDKLWYVGDWNGFSFQSILSWLVRELKLKQDTGYLKNVFVRNFQQTLRSYDSDFSSDFLALLSEEDRRGLKESGHPLTETFENEDPSDSSNPYATDRYDKLEHKDGEEQGPIAESTSSTSHNQQTENQENNPEEDNVNEYESDKINLESDNNKKVRTPRTPTTPNEPRVPQQPVSNSEDQWQESKAPTGQLPSRPVVNPIPQHNQSSRKDLQERLKETWNRRRQAENDMPHPSHRTQYYEEQNINSGTQISDERGTFFGKGSDPNKRKQPAGSGSKANKKNNQAIQAAERAQDNLDLYYLLDNTPKYSYLWFMYLMEIMYGDQLDTNPETLVVEFSFIKHIENTTSFSLQQPSKNLPKWLEYPATLSLELRGQQSFSFEPVILFVKDNELAIDTYMLSDNHRDMLKSADKVVIRAKGRSVNHIKSLCDRFAQLNYSDSYSLKQNLPANIRYIYGPAGTGKTTNVAKQMMGKLKDIECNVNILALAPTNKAADVIAERFLSEDKAKRYKLNLYRFGTTESQILIEEGVATPTCSNFISYDHHHVVVTTIARFAYDYLQRSEKDPVALCDYKWDYIFIDEASMIDIVSIIYVLFKAHPKEFIIAGDPMQLRPISQNDYEPENIYDMVNICSFALAVNRQDVEALKIQHRSIPILGNLTSELAYDGILQSDRQDKDAKPLKLTLSGLKHINFIGFRTDPFDLIYGLDKINMSAFHLHSVLFTYRFASYIAKQIQFHYSQAIREKNDPKCTKDTERYSLGIISPYGAQAESISNILKNRPIDTPQCKISCGTVHKFQGDECDIMLVVLNHSDRVTEDSHVNNLNLINVALSRARDYVFIITSQNEYPGFTMKADIGNLIPKEKMSIMYCSDIEQQLWGDSNFIHNHTYYSIHTPVNVFYSSQNLYEVRKDDTAVDIQINDKYDIT